MKVVSEAVQPQKQKNATKTHSLLLGNVDFLTQSVEILTFQKVVTIFWREKKSVPQRFKIEF